MEENAEVRIHRASVVNIRNHLDRLKPIVPFNRVRRRGGVLLLRRPR